VAAGASLQPELLHHDEQVEDNYVGGLWSAVAEAAAEQGAARVVGMTVRKIPKSGTPDDVMKYCGLSPEHIAAKVKELVR
jgi:transketolase C-terminal domain/subunit